MALCSSLQRPIKIEEPTICGLAAHPALHHRAPWPGEVTLGTMEGVVQGPATPLRRLRCALGIIPTANKTGNSLFLDSLLFHTPPLCTVQYVPWGLFFLLLSPRPHPKPQQTRYPCVLGLGVGVMGNAGLCSRSAHDLWVPSLLPLHFGAFEGVSKIV